MKILVTGAAGFIGNELAIRLTARGNALPEQYGSYPALG